ncbi:hypothetical protein CONLIGDRAFT_685763 [Coniochaeta ligniaria NRRL 30616]|uniref:Uncharacterized protein n=1 Tax=Coniochaeta ligniaria NRRL 30616 TaxID=1408157 RepID=A0A1J7J9D3_9PEZI|nr:hypothetical protein CONLIGDRAFT_685763 [Coniochaeta ligniaria NRRL 30616]
MSTCIWLHLRQPSLSTPKLSSPTHTIPAMLPRNGRERSRQRNLQSHPEVTTFSKRNAQTTPRSTYPQYHHAPDYHGQSTNPAPPPQYVAQGHATSQQMSAQYPGGRMRAGHSVT